MKKKVLREEGKIEGANLIVQYANKLPTTGESITETPLEKIREKDNVRTEYKNVEELADSIHQKGLLQPIVVTKAEDGFFEIVFGHRRFKAFLLLSQKHPGEYAKIRAIVKERDSFDPEEVKEIQLIENIQRENLTALEMKDALEHLRQKGLSHREIAEKLGKGEGYVKQLFIGVRVMNENPDVIAQAESYAGVTLSMADFSEVRPLSPKDREETLKARLSGEIKTRADLRERVRELKESQSEEYRKKREEKQAKPAAFIDWRSEDEIRARFSFRFSEADDGSKKALAVELQKVLEKLGVQS